MIRQKYLSPSSAAVFLDVSTHLLQKWRSLGIGIPYTKLGDSANAPIRYSLEELEEYLSSKKILTM